MKVIEGNKVYVQNIDVSRLLQMVAGLGISCPEGVLNQIYGEWFICVPDNQYEFKEYEGKEIVDFFSKLDFIIDYDSIKDLSDDEIMAIGEQICTERNRIARRYNNLSEEEAEKICEKVHAEIKVADFKLEGIRDYLWFKQGHIKFSLPNGIDYPEGYKGKRPGVLSRIFKKKD